MESFNLKRRPLAERLELAGCTDEEIRLLKSAGELLESLKSLVEWAKDAEVQIDREWGHGRTREEIESAEDWCSEIRDAEAVIAEVERPATGNMTSHELARKLLELPDLPVATHSNNHTYANGADARTAGPLKIGLLKHYAGDHVVIGNFYKKNINKPNWYVTEMFHGEAPDELRH